MLHLQQIVSNEHLIASNNIQLYQQTTTTPMIVVLFILIAGKKLIVFWHSISKHPPKHTPTPHT
jgi:hypothetical protein